MSGRRAIAERGGLVVIGGVAAGMSAAAKARRASPDLPITVLEKGRDVSYGACGMPYLLSGVVPAARSLIARTAAEFAKAGIDVLLGQEAVSIDIAARQVLVNEVNTGEHWNLSYDRLVVATGARPVIPPIPGIESNGVHVLRTLDDGRRLLERLNTVERERPGGKRVAAVVGAGYVGIEAAEAFSSRGYEVHLFEMLNQVLPNFGTELARLAAQVLEENGVLLHLSTPVQKLAEADGHVSVHAGTVDLEADVVLIAAGIRPNVEVAQTAGVRLGASGAIAVDRHQRTNVEGIYAAGDCAEAYDVVTGGSVWVPLGTTANKQGRVAGENAADGDSLFGGVVRTAIVKAFDRDFARTGVTEAEARNLYDDAASTTVTGQAIAGYIPGGGPMTVHLVYRTGNGRLLGAQLAAPSGNGKRIDVLAAAVQHALTLDQVQSLDLAYAPTVAPVWDPVLVAANVAVKNVESRRS